AVGNVWIGTSEGRLFCIKDTVVTDETEHVQGTPFSIRCLYATSDGALWIGYAGSGLGCYKGGRYTRMTTKQRLRDNYIPQIFTTTPSCRRSWWNGSPWTASRWQFMTANRLSVNPKFAD